MGTPITITTTLDRMNREDTMIAAKRKNANVVKGSKTAATAIILETALSRRPHTSKQKDAKRPLSAALETFQCSLSPQRMFWSAAELDLRKSSSAALQEEDNNNHLYDHYNHTDDNHNHLYDHYNHPYDNYNHPYDNYYHPYDHNNHTYDNYNHPYDYHNHLYDHYNHTYDNYNHPYDNYNHSLEAKKSKWECHHGFHKFSGSSYE
ncbi:hypothetical protein Q1695_001327 [Nippostrongylus brasiliensis]|nr:hypothetical protein Q1695_001327 [Nippostrongylus brasiliensis]